MPIFCSLPECASKASRLMIGPIVLSDDYVLRWLHTHALGHIQTDVVHAAESDIDKIVCLSLLLIASCRK